MARRQIIYVWNARTGKRVSPTTRAKSLRVSIGGTELFGAAKNATINKWRTGLTQTGKRRKVKTKRKGKARKSGEKGRGVPQEFTSPFRRFLFNLDQIRPGQRADIIALIEIDFPESSPQRGEILPARSVIQPLKLGSKTRAQAERLTENDVFQAFRGNPRARKGAFVRVVGIVGLKKRKDRMGIKIRG